MKPNLLRQRLQEGTIPVGHMVIEFGTRGLAKILESSKVDFVLLDMEHSGIELERIADLIAWLKATPVTPIVRVPTCLYHFVARCMDAGAMGIMAPNVESAEQARSLVSSVKYAPQGRRGLGLGTAHNDYVAPDSASYMNEANANTSVICQIESVTGVANLEEIAATPGVDVLWLGHFDLSSSMGIVGQFNHPEFVRALTRVPEIARRFGQAAGIQPGTHEQAQAWMRLGYNVISMGSDIAIYSSALRDSIASFRALAKLVS
ncbi:MAG: HpcH/HpaI aldolase family protein [Acidobacteriota bacterium]